MNITGTITLFVEDVKSQKGDFRRYTTSISNTNKEGQKENASIRVMFNKELDKKAQSLETTKAYQLKVEDAWLKFDKYEKEGKKMVSWIIFVNKGTITKSTDIKKVDENMPF